MMLPVHKHHTAEGAVDCHVSDCDVYQIQRQARAAVPLPIYTGTRIYTCPACDGDVRQDGLEDYWCPACRRCWYFTQVGAYEDGEPDD